MDAARSAEASGLGVRVQDLLDDLDHAKHAVDGAADAAPQLYRRIGGRVDNLIAAEQRELERLRADLRSGDMVSLWQRIADERARVEGILREALAVAQGAAARRDGLDSALGDVSDRMLAALADRLNMSWDGLSVLAEREFSGEQADIVRLRFPLRAIWNLPVAAHEFAHFAGPERNYREARGAWHPFPDLLALVEEAERGRFEELFADAFAAFAIGPSYALMCFTTRFDPLADATDQHPADHVRAEAVLATLEWMEPTAANPYLGIVEVLGQRWQSEREAVGVAQPIDRSAERRDAHIPELLAFLDEHFADVRYDGNRRASMLAPQLGRPGGVPPAADCDIADLLNAAWIARFRAGEGNRPLIARIAAQARELCLELAEGPGL